MKNEELTIEGKPAEEWVKENSWVEIDGWLVDPAYAKDFREQQKRMVEVECSDPTCTTRQFKGSKIDPWSGKGGLSICMNCGAKNQAVRRD